MVYNTDVLDAAIARKLVPKRLLNQAHAVQVQNKKPDTKSFVSGLVFGRRDWIRTNDPYHVKVVL